VKLSFVHHQRHLFSNLGLLPFLIGSNLPRPRLLWGLIHGREGRYRARATDLFHEDLPSRKRTKRKKDNKLMSRYIHTSWSSSLVYFISSQCIGLGTSIFNSPLHHFLCLFLGAAKLFMISSSIFILSPLIKDFGLFARILLSGPLV